MRLLFPTEQQRETQRRHAIARFGAVELVQPVRAQPTAQPGICRGNPQRQTSRRRGDRKTLLLCLNRAQGYGRLSAHMLTLCSRKKNV